MLEAGVDHGGNPIEPFVDADGGMPMRCCLVDSEPGDTVAIVAWSPFPWQDVYTEIGPIFIHGAGCPGLKPTSALPRDFEQRNMIVRPYGSDRAIDYELVRPVAPGEGLEAAIAEALARDHIDFVHARNPVGGCYAFTARLAGPHDAREDRRA